MLFDIDYAAPARAFRALGLQHFEEVYRQAAQHPMFDLLETGRVSNEEFLQWLHSFVPDATPTQVLDAWNSILTGLNLHNVSLAAKVKDAGFRTFVLSNTNAIHAQVFGQMIERDYGLKKFKSHFDEVMYSHELGLKKPHAETYLAVCGRHGLEPAQCLFIDDSSQHVNGALEAGLQAALLAPGASLSHLLRQYIGPI